MSSSLLPKMNAAVVWVPEIDIPKISRGIILPSAYRLAERGPFWATDRQSLGFLIEGPDIPEVGPGETKPSLLVAHGYDAIVVLPWAAMS